MPIKQGSPFNSKKPLGSLTDIAKNVDDDEFTDDSEEDDDEEIESTESNLKNARPTAPPRHRFTKANTRTHSENSDTETNPNIAGAQPPQGSRTRSGRPRGNGNAVMRPSAPPRAKKPMKKPSLTDIATNLSDDESEDDNQSKGKQVVPQRPSRPPVQKKPSLQDISKEVSDSSEDDSVNVDKVPPANVNAKRPTRPSRRATAVVGIFKLHLQGQKSRQIC